MKKIGIILGSGLNKFSKELKDKKILYRNDDGIHKKKIIFGKIGNRELYIFEGRNHYYENASVEKILFNVNKSKEYGIDFLIITNAAGGLNPDYKVADLMIISSHINLFLKNNKFTNFIDYYDKNIIFKIVSNARKNKIRLHSGVYCASPGPQYETNKEIEFLKKINVDAVGMSTIPEILYANSLGIKTIAISCITNLLTSNSTSTVEHNEVLLAGNKSYKNFSKLVNLIINDY
jgi:purine-nucleoside phosphorylase